MRTPFRENRISTLIVIPSAIIVAALAILQYRWSTRISEATAIRLADSLQMSMINWQKDFFRYFSEIGLALRIDPLEDAPGDLNQYARRFAEWQAVAKYPALVSGVYLLKSDSAALRLNAETRRFEPSQWPSAFGRLRAELTQASAEFVRGSASPEPHELFDMAGWRFDEEGPALLHPFVLGSTGSKSLNLQSVTWIAIELNRQVIESRILSDLSRNYFQGTDGLDYLVAVVAGTRPARVLYASDAGFGDPMPGDADGIIDLFGRAGSPVRVFHVPSTDKGPDPYVRISWFPFLREPGEDLDWRLVVRHRRGGPLGAFVGEMRRRDLAIGFGVLLVLVINMAMLIVTSHRAQRLAQMQMDFVTAVSHELRTPLTVILSRRGQHLQRSSGEWPACEAVRRGHRESSPAIVCAGGADFIVRRDAPGRRLALQFAAPSGAGRSRHSFGEHGGIDRGGAMYGGVRNRGRIAADLRRCSGGVAMPSKFDCQCGEVRKRRST